MVFQHKVDAATKEDRLYFVGEWLRLILAALAGAYAAAIVGTLLYAAIPPALSWGQGRPWPFGQSITATIVILSPVLAICAAWITVAPGFATIPVYLLFCQRRPRHLLGASIVIWALYLWGIGLSQGELARTRDWLVSAFFVVGCGVANAAGFWLVRQFQRPAGETQGGKIELPILRETDAAQTKIHETAEMTR